MNRLKLIVACAMLIGIITQFELNGGRGQRQYRTGLDVIAARQAYMQGGSNPTPSPTPQPQSTDPVAALQQQLAEQQKTSAEEAEKTRKLQADLERLKEQQNQSNIGMQALNQKQQQSMKN